MLRKSNVKRVRIKLNFTPWETYCIRSAFVYNQPPFKFSASGVCYITSLHWR